jgi:hypothetical protein
MLKCTLDREKFESLNTVIKDKNNISPLSRYMTKAYSEEDIDILNRMGMVNSEGDLLETIQPTIHILSEPYAVVKLTFTGGVGTYEHHVNYDRTFKNPVSFTVTPDNFSIDDETNPHSIVHLLQDFVGKSNLKSISFSQKFNTPEALVIASILDMERRSNLRAFIDEIPINRNSYNAGMIWRIINSTSSSIQWFVSIINEVIGEHMTLSLQQVQNAIEQLKIKGVIEQRATQFQLSGELAHLSDRMIIIDNVLSVQAARLDEQNETVSAGFTCIQAGVHDLLLLDYNGKDIIFETITSAKLLDYLEQFYDCEAYFSKLQL